MLRRALASALHQTYESFDIVVVDDSSDSPVVIEQTTGRGLTLVRSPHQLGFAGAINFGARHASGKRIALLDDDDEYAPDFLRRTQARFAALPDREFSWCNTIFLHYDGTDQPVRETVRSFSENYESEEEFLWTRVSIGSGYGFTIDREVFLKLGGFDAENFWAIADTEFFFRLIAAGCQPAVVTEPLMRVHKHSGLKMTDANSYRNRARQCELLRDRYADVIARHPRLGDRVRISIEELTALALALDSEQSAG